MAKTLPVELKGVNAQRPTSQLSIFDWLNSRVSTFLAIRQRERTVEFVRLMREMRDYTPDIAKAVNNLITYAGTDYELKAYRASSAGTDSPVVDKIGQKIIDDFATRMYSEYSGGIDVGYQNSKAHIGLRAFIDQIHLMVFTQGAYAVEVQLTSQLDDIFEVFPIDPVYLDFKKNPDTLMWEMGVNTFYVPIAKKLQADSNVGFFPLNPILAKYFPYEPDVNQPAGRAPMTALLEIVYFQAEFLRDLKSVVHQAGYPRIDLEIVTEILNQVIEKQRPELTTPDMTVERQQFLDDYLNDLQVAIQTLSADDAFVHFDSVKTNYVSPKSTAFDIDKLLNVIDHQIVSATLQLPVLLGRNEGATTTHATVAFQSYLKTVATFQRVSKAAVIWLFNLLLRIHGRNSYVSFEYINPSTSDDFLTAQALNMNYQTYSEAAKDGLISQDEMAQKLFGHNAVKQIDLAVDPNAQATQPNLGGEPAPVVQDASAKAAQE